LDNLPSAILWTWPYHVSWFCPISFIIVSYSPICFLIVTFLILSFLDILEDLLRASSSVALTRLLLFSVSLHVSEPHNSKYISLNYHWLHPNNVNICKFASMKTKSPHVSSKIMSLHVI
jgi:hypothetical protein